MDLYFTRHGKTEWNLERRFQGMKGDSPLLPSSFLEIQALGQHIADVPFEHIYCSSAPRAQITAQEINKQLTKSVAITPTDALLEMGYGILEGQSIDEMLAKYPIELENMRFHMDQYDPTPFEGETVAAMIERMTSFITEKVGAHMGPVLFVGHGSSMTAAVQALLGKPASDYRSMGGLYNNSLTILETETKQLPYQLKLWNDASFLEKNASLDSLL